jgi:ankyrin repeat protein
VKQRAPKLLKVVLSHPYHDINHEPAFGSSPLFEAMALLTHSEPSADAIAVVSMLIRHGASIISARGENALLRAAVLGRRQLLATMLKTLDAQHQEHIFKVDGEGRNILHYAAAEPGQVLIAAASLSEGTFQSLATAVDEQNKTALILAAIHGCGLACKRLVEVVEPVAVDHRDADGSTALHYAVAFANDFAARTLVDAGASCHLADADGFTVWDLLQEGDDVMKAVLRRCSPR